MRNLIANSLLSLSNLSTKLAVRAGRETIDTDKLTAGLSVTRPDDNIGNAWETLELQRNNLFGIGTSRMVDTVMAISSEANKAFRDLVQFGNPGYTIDVRPASARPIVDAFLERLEMLHGPLTGMLDMFWGGLFLGGGFFFELVVDNDLLPINLAILDPNSAAFVNINSAEAGGQYQALAQQQRFSQRLLNRELAFYAGYGSSPTKPLGRPIINPGLYASVFLLTIMQDLRRVIAHQGYPRYHYKIDIEELAKLINTLHPNLIGNDARIASFIQQHQTQIKNQLESLSPTSDFIGLSTIDISVPRGSSTGFNLQGVEGYIKLLERSITRGFNSTLLLMGIQDAATEANAGSQLEHYVSGIESLQDTNALLVSRALSLVLRLYGRRGEVILKYKKQRISDKKVLAETEGLAIDNIITKRDAGLITSEQARSDADGLRIPFYLGE